MNVGYLLTNSAHKYPERLAVISEEGRWTFEEFDQRTNRLGGAMLKAGLKKGDRVAILFFNSSYFVEVYFAALKVGLVATPVNFRFVGPEIAYVLNDSQPSMLFYGSEFETTILDIREQLDTIRVFVSPHDGASSSAVGYEEFLSKRKCIKQNKPFHKKEAETKGFLRKKIYIQTFPYQ